MSKDKISPKKTRSYDNSSRLEKSNTKRQEIIKNYIDLLIEKQGQDFSLEELAAKSSLSIRTLFRFFGDKQTLTRELDTYLSRYLLAAAPFLESMTFEDYVAYVFSLFDENEALIKAYLYTHFGQTSRMVFRKKFLELLYKKLTLQLNLHNPTPEQESKIQYIISLVNANIWSDHKESFHRSGHEISKTVKWAVKKLIEDI